MNPQCHNCGKVVALRAGMTTEFTVKEEFRKERPDTPEKIYLCVKCGADPKVVERYKQTPWYGGQKII